MSSICGIFNRTGKPVSKDILDAVIDVLGHWGPDNTGSRCGGEVGLGHVMLHNTPESLKEILPLYDPRSGLAITADARIDNREELFRLLDIDGTEQSSIPDSMLILKAFLRWGRDCVTRLLGDFAFAIWSEKEKKLFCARDHMGCKPLFYFLSHDTFVFATEMKGIFTVTGEPGRLSDTWIADALTAMVADKEYTPYEHILRLPPAHWLEVGAGDIKKQRYWDLDREKEIRLNSDEEYVEAFREKLIQAVRPRVRSRFPAGCELSGGLDSSAITALAAQSARQNRLKLISFSHVLPQDSAAASPSLDEREFNEMLHRFAGIEHGRFITAGDRGVIETLEQGLILQDGPTMSNFYNFSDRLYETGAAEGIRTLFSGFGGDELVSTRAGSLFGELAASREWRVLWHEMPHERQWGRLMSPVKLAWIMAKVYFPFLKSLYGTLYGTYKKLRKRTSKDQVSHHLDTYSLNPEFYAAAGIEQKRDALNRRTPGTTVRSHQYWRIMHPHVPLRLEYCAIAAAARKIEYCYPLLDIRLMEFHLACPSRMKRRNGYGRYLFRKANEGLIPPEIQWRQDKSRAAIPAANQRFKHDSGKIAQLIKCSTGTQAQCFMDLDQLLKRRDRVLNWQTSPVPMRQGTYLNALMLLLYFNRR